MNQIVIGKVAGKNVSLDLDILLRTRLLIQANSGGGKSYLLRRLAEQFFGKIQVILIDPEGEFATLREKFGYVLVGEGGETLADPRSAKLLAQLRHLRKKEFGSHIVEKRRRGRPGKGLWEYLVRRASPSANTQLILCLAERSVLRERQP